MKKKLNFGIIALFLLCLFSACSDSNNDSKSIDVPSGQELIQNVYADDESGTSGVKFTTSAAWTSSVVETTKKSIENGTSQTSPNPNWVSITPASGDKAGIYTININLSENYTGEERSATITINCNGEKIEIKVIQDGKTKDGIIPEEKYDLAFITMIMDDNDLEKLVILNEDGKIKENIYTFTNKEQYYYLLDYNEHTNDAYIEVSVDSVRDDIYSINTKTKQQKKIIDGLNNRYEYRITEDAKYLFYIKKDYGTNISEVIRISTADKKETVLAKKNASLSDDNFLINKDGTVIVLMDNTNMVTVLENGEEKYRYNLSEEGWLELSPAGNKLLIVYENSGLKICNLDGSDSNIIKSNNSDLDIESHFWSADGKYIYFDYYTGFPNNIYKVDIETKDLTHVSSSSVKEHLFNGGVKSIKIVK